ncbi:MAG: dihydroorotate dehydrogenase-like protein [Dactylosporangium sp.]|nr:dihydroorotate dehydrogenase-like protein [Dactylosporangium sp.]NNJ60211.1 dihydroorotate dehydrogenase-like protein [Dactylosporangium sp.]
MTDLTSTYLGLTLTGPVIASAGPHTGRVETLLRLEAAGASAAVLPSLFEEEVVNEELSLYEALEQGTDSFAESLDYFPHTDFYDIGPQRHVRLVEEAKQTLSIPVIASVNASQSGSWKRYATMMADAGADAIELNIYAMAVDPARGAADVEASYLDIIREVRGVVSVPLAVKLSPYFSSLPHFAAEAVDAGADGLVLFNRFYQPDLDLRTLDVKPTVELSTPSDLRLPLRWLAILRPQLRGTSLAATSGVHSAKDVVKTLLVGADVACMTSALLRHGPEHIRTVLDGLSAWLAENEYESVSLLRGSVSSAGAEDPAAFERANYVRVLSSYEPAPNV